MINPLAILGAVIGAGAVFGLGVNVGFEWGEGKAVRKYQDILISEAKTNTDLIEVKNTQIQQCQAQVDEINRVTAETEQRINALLSKDATERQRAQREARARAAAASERNDRLISALLNLKENIDATNLNPCMGEPVDPEYIGLLNDALDAATARGDD